MRKFTLNFTDGLPKLLTGFEEGLFSCVIPGLMEEGKLTVPKKGLKIIYFFTGSVPIVRK